MKENTKAPAESTLETSTEFRNIYATTQMYDAYAVDRLINGIDQKCGGAFHFKGNVYGIESLSSIQFPSAGDVYNDEYTGKNYVYVGPDYPGDVSGAEGWDTLGGVFDLSNYYTKADFSANQVPVINDLQNSITALSSNKLEDAFDEIRTDNGSIVASGGMELAIYGDNTRVTVSADDGGGGGPRAIRIGVDVSDKLYRSALSPFQAMSTISTGEYAQYTLDTVVEKLNSVIEGLSAAYYYNS